MTAPEFRAALKRLGLSQIGFAATAARIGGESMPLRTVQHWVGGSRAIPPTVPALLALMERAPEAWRDVA